MSRQKIYQSNAEKCKAFRLKMKLENRQVSNLDRLYEWRANHPIEYQKGIARRDKQSRYRKRANKMFIGIDGEGITLDNKKNTVEYECNGISKSVGTHYYTLLGSSEGKFIEDYKGLSTVACLDFLLDTPQDAILIGFVINYDVNMLLVDISKEDLEILWKTSQLKWNEYELVWLPSKLFMVRKDGVSRCWYDVFGYFQKSFIKSLIDMGFEVPKEITQGKENRSSFTKKQKESIRFYNKLECDLLVKMMNKLRDAFVKVGFVPYKWHGAGTIASVIFEKYGIRRYNATPNDLKDKIVSAYYGGRNQLLIQGEIGDCWNHDINSAYPASMATLPTSIGQWEEEKPYSRNAFIQWGLHYVEWNLKDSVIITPFPFRYKQRIYWPHKGQGWYWSPEVANAIETFGSSQVKILKTFQFYPENDEQPFSFIPGLYEQRKQLLKEGNDAQLAIKLGLNSSYGKVAQSIGFRDALPAYQNYFWAGYITSVTRAKIFKFALTSPKDIVFFSTDGIVSRKRLAEGSKDKELGAWDVKQLKNFFALMSGVYTFETDEIKYKSRGFNYKSVDYDELRRIWREQGIDGVYNYKETRFVGLGHALKGNFETWRKWIRQDRKINFLPIGIPEKLENFLYRIHPAQPDAKISEKYKLKSAWFEGGEGEEYLSLLDQK